MGSTTTWRISNGASFGMGEVFRCEMHASFIENGGMNASMFVWEFFLLLLEGVFLTFYGYQV